MPFSPFAFTRHRFACLVFLPLLGCLLRAQQFDTTAPVIHSVTFTPTNLDAPKGPLSINVTATVSDALSGTAYICVYFGSPNNQQLSLSTCLSPIDPFVPNQNQNWQGSLMFFSENEEGNWILNFATAGDNVGNSNGYSTNDPLLSALPPLNLTSN